MTQCFARNITRNQLAEYVQALPFANEVTWVDRYSRVCCNVKSDTKQVVFVQMGPSIDLLQNLRNRNIKLWILNTEQMSRALPHKDEEEDDSVAFDFEAWMFCYLRPKRFVSIMDYSEANLAIWKSMFKTCEFMWVPFLCKPGSALSGPIGIPIAQDSKELQTKQVAFVGDTSSFHRFNKLKALSEEVFVLPRVFGHARDEILAKFKIVLNIHFNKTYSVFEEIRCLPCILNKQIVISESSLINPNNPLFRFVIFASYDRLEQCVRDTIANYDMVYRKLYVDNAKFDTLFEDLKRYAVDHCAKTQTRIWV